MPWVVGRGLVEANYNLAPFIGVHDGQLADQRIWICHCCVEQNREAAGDSLGHISAEVCGIVSQFRACQCSINNAPKLEMKTTAMTVLFIDGKRKTIGGLRLKKIVDAETNWQFLLHPRQWEII